MDGSHFDTLARSFATSGTRRRLLSRLLGGVVLGAPVALLGPGDRAAKGKKGQGEGAPGGRATTATRIAAGARPARTSVSARAPSAVVPDDWRTNERSVGRTEDPDPDQEVCCLGQGDSCHNNNDCECCGTLSCHPGAAAFVMGPPVLVERSITSGRASATGSVDRAERINAVRSRRVRAGGFRPGRPISVRDHSRRGTRVCRETSQHHGLSHPSLHAERRLPRRARCVYPFSGPAPLGLFSGVWPVILMAG